MRLVRFFFQQRAASLARPLWRRLARCLLEDLLARQDYELGVHFIDAREMARLNETYLGHKGSTDVITFNYQENSSQGYLKCGRCGSNALPIDGRAALPRRRKNLGDKSTGFRAAESNHPRLHGELFISVDDALIHARRYRVLWQEELARYLVHGVLHLEGFDDKASPSRLAMKRRENSLLKALSLRFSLGKLGRL